MPEDRSLTSTPKIEAPPSEAPRVEAHADRDDVEEFNAWVLMDQDAEGQGTQDEPLREASPSPLFGGWHAAPTPTATGEGPGHWSTPFLRPGNLVPQSYSPVGKMLLKRIRPKIIGTT